MQEDEQACCYARSDKYWVTDPTGIAWETFHTLARIPVYGEDTAVFDHGTSVVPTRTGPRNAGAAYGGDADRCTLGCCRMNIALNPRSDAASP